MNVNDFGATGFKENPPFWLDASAAVGEVIPAASAAGWSIAHNAFSGSIPKEIGNLKELTLLSIGVNNFSGTLPPEIGNLVKLEELYINSCGLGGEIPSTFANLKSMRVLLASDSAFSGKIPEFIGNWTKLQQLYLRNALISDTIPSDIGEYTRLQRLDLSFNNLTGPIPSSLFNMSSLESLFLGNNSLSGNLPNQKSNTLQTIDLSYNYLSGSFPLWVSSNLQLNLVANNFTFDSSNISVLPQLNCLQRNFPCNRDLPRYANFAIKCGGPERKTGDGIVFEAENSSLGAASFNVTSSEKWAVSNVGLFTDRINPAYVENTLAQVTSTNAPELYQTSRISPSSLRYYGLGLENGNYTISLFFAETAFDDRSSQTWESLGRRIFDIYIQGSLRLKDFDISKEAGGVRKALVSKFNATVSENYLEIHLFWAGKGTCCTPVQGYYGPIISALSVVPDFMPTVSGIPPHTRKEKEKTGLIVGVTLSAAIVGFILLFAFLYFNRKTRKDDEDVFVGIDYKPNTFSYAELRTATEDFSPSNKLGEGGFGPVYKGTLFDGREVAVKQLSVESSQGNSQFITEIATISAVQHRNLVKLYGCCIEGNRRLLVYEYLQNKSLDKALFAKNSFQLDWPTRFNICIGTAKGLAYLHEESRPRIVHRDVKASNI
ncbi:hypothetical protein GH714_008553 [Hevea brasiliensis]|uniref:non-specific serine/threonine protein kinase n=1 Tax=Hevea brasiliensis TaxID=3981 RepID=A0A6A6LQN2_HEVBR|nr:hypothetical protein GH714_008553 [Hevea brasiliensis]